MDAVCDGLRKASFTPTTEDELWDVALGLMHKLLDAADDELSAKDIEEYVRQTAEKLGELNARSAQSSYEVARDDRLYHQGTGKDGVHRARF